MTDSAVVGDDPTDYSSIQDALQALDNGDVFEVLAQAAPELRSNEDFKCHCMWLGRPELLDNDGRETRITVACRVHAVVGSMGMALNYTLTQWHRCALIIHYAYSRCVRVCCKDDLTLQFHFAISCVQHLCPLTSNHVYGQFIPRSLGSGAVTRFPQGILSSVQSLVKFIVSNPEEAAVRFRRGVASVRRHDLCRVIDVFTGGARRVSFEDLILASSIVYLAPLLLTEPNSLPLGEYNEALRRRICDAEFSIINPDHTSLVKSHPLAVVNLVDHTFCKYEPRRRAFVMTSLKMFDLLALLPMSFWFALPSSGGKKSLILDYWVTVLSVKSQLKRGAPWRHRAQQKLYHVFRHYIAVDRWILQQWIRHAQSSVRLLVHDVVCHVATFLYGDHTFPRNFYRKTFTLTREL